MSVSAPIRLHVRAEATRHRIDWTNTASGVGYGVESYTAATAGGPWTLVDTTYGSVDTAFNNDTADNTTAYYKARAFATGLDGSPGYSAYTSVVYCTYWTKTVGPDAVTVTDEIANTVTSTSGTYTVEDAVTVSTLYEDPTTFANTYTDTLTITDAYRDSAPITTAFNYYLCSDAGAVYKYSAASTTDAGTTFSASWRTKAVDFSDDNAPLDRYKIVYGATLFYEDIATNATVGLAVSADGGASWTTYTKIVGASAGTPKSADFWFIKHGEAFQFKVESSSQIKVLGIRVEYDTGGYRG